MKVPATFIGRVDELAQLDAASSDGARLVTLWGPGGAGKTTLASKWAEGRRAHGTTIVWCELVTARTRTELSTALATALGVDVRDDVHEAVLRALEGRDALLVADNAEQLDAEARDALGAIASRRDGGVLVTSRELLGIAGEWVVRVDPLPEADALALYATLSGAPADAVAETIVRRLDALPLAIELAAARASLLGSEELLSRLDRKLDLLGKPATTTDRPARHGTLRAALMWSWELLDDVERLALMACATFEGAFDAALADHVLELDGTSALDALEHLRQRALLHVASRDESGRPRLYLLESVRELAREQMFDRGLAAELFERHAQAVIERAEPLASRVRRGGIVDPALSARRADLIAASARETASSARALLCVAALCSVTGPLDLVIEAADRVVADPILRAPLAIAKGEALRATGRLDEAETIASDALAIARQLDRRSTTTEASGGSTWVAPIEADALRLSGTVARSRGDSARAVELLTRARELYTSLDERALAGICLGEIGAAHQSGGRLDLARACYADAIAVHVVEKSLRAEGVERSYLAVATHRSGEPRAALALHEAALAIHRSVGHPRLEGAELLHLGFVHHELGAPGMARAAFADARHALGAAGARGLEALAMVLEARLDADEGYEDRARAALELAAKSAPRGWARLDATRLVVVGHLAFANDPRAAADAYTAALTRSRDVEVGFEALTPAYLALALARLGASPAEIERHVVAARVQVERSPNRHIKEAFDILRGAIFTAPAESVASSSEVRRALAFAGRHRGLVIGSEARTVRLPDGRSIDLSRRRNLRLVLLALVNARRESAGVCLSSDALIAVGWPNEKMHAEAAMKRLHTAIWTLRSLGFEALIVSTDDGYMLDPRTPIELG